MAWKCRDGYPQMDTGDCLEYFAGEMIRAFEAGHLFDWLRGEWTLPEALLPEPQAELDSSQEQIKAPTEG